MRFRLGLVLGFGCGYYLGAKAGRARYEQLNDMLTRVRGSDAYEATAEKARALVDDQVEKVKEVVEERVDLAKEVVEERVERAKELLDERRGTNGQAGPQPAGEPPSTLPPGPPPAGSLSDDRPPGGPPA